MKKIIVDQQECIGCGTCVALAPEIFQLGKNGKAEVINQETNNKKEVDEAINSCPVKAITLKNSG